MSSRFPRQVVKTLVEAAEHQRLWRGFGRRYVLPRLEVIHAAGDPLGRWRHVYPDFSARRQLERTLEFMWIVVHGRRALGGLMLHPLGSDLFLHTMRVRRPCRGWGVGGYLLQQVMIAADGQNKAIWLQVLPDNRPALALYRKAGFRECHDRATLLREGYLTMCRPARNSRHWEG